MKGLMMKEFYLMYKYCRMYLLIAVVFAIASAAGDGNMFILFYPTIVGGTISVTLLSYDEKSRWDIYAGTFPYTKRAIVSAKYLVTLLYLAFMVMLVSVSQAVNVWRAAGEFQLRSHLSVIVSLVSVGLIVPGVMLPVIFKLGVDKGRIVYYGIVVAACAMFGVLGVSGALGVNEANVAWRPGEGLIPALLAVAVIIFGVSWILSVKFYREREL